MIPKISHFISLILSLLLILTVISAKAQIKNRIIKPEKAEQFGVNNKSIKSLSSFMLPRIDEKQLFKEDSIESRLGKPWPATLFSSGFGGF